MSGGPCLAAVLASLFVVDLVFAVEEGRIYHGTIREDAPEKQEVDLDFPLFVRNREGLSGDEICGYTVYKPNSVPIPFQVILEDRKTGSAKIVLAKGSELNYESVKSYEFEIAADDCVTGAHSVRESVHIDILDVNEFAPAWKEQTYIAEATEGQLYDQILKLETRDEDGSETFSKVCQFHLLTTEVPFEITKEGYLRNTEPLDYSSKHNFILEVQAEDCGKKLSDRLLVNILVKPECKVGWKGIRSQMDYVVKSGQKSVASNATLEMCDEVCQVTQLSVSIRLRSNEAETGCEIGADTIASRNSICGRHPDTIDLLPGGKHLPSIDGAVKPDGVVEFDGKTVAIEVPSETFNGHLESRFTMSTWLRHKRQSAEEEEVKQHILCSADGEGMSRHHYSLFLHNCRLVLLLRKEPGPGVDMNVFQPAEWRWKLPEICDDKWHHYAISMEFPEARLFLDGKLFVRSKHNEDIIDDWPLHPSRKVHTTKLIVGACWEGTEGHFGQFLRGQMAELALVNNDTETDRVIGCVNSCREKIDFHAISEMDTGMSVSMNSAMTQIDITGHTKESVENLVSKIGYINPRVNMTSESSHLTFATSVRCADGSNMSIIDSDVAIDFVEEQPSKIMLTGSTQLVRDDREVALGEKIFHDLLIVMQPFVAKDSDLIEVQAVAGVAHHLEMCSVVVQPEFDVANEQFTYPENLVKQLGLTVEFSIYGVNINGEAKISDYTDVMQAVQYVHKKVDDLNTRAFHLTCSKDGGLVVSNELVVELDVIHGEQKQGQSADRAAADKFFHSVSNYKADASKISTKQEDKSSGVGIAAAVVICVGFLVFIVILGIIRIRSVNQRSVEVNVEERQEMEWDNSALTITVNPMDNETVYEESEVNGLHAEETDTDDDIGSFHDDRADSSDEDEHGQAKSHDLEWDSTTATY